MTTSNYVSPSHKAAGTTVRVYALINQDGDIIYVGRTRDPDRRLSEHVQRFGFVTMMVLEHSPKWTANYTEGRWIEEFGLEPLANKAQPFSGQRKRNLILVKRAILANEDEDGIAHISTITQWCKKRRLVGFRMREAIKTLEAQGAVETARGRLYNLNPPKEEGGS